MYCPNCGSLAREGESICEVCGGVLPVSPHISTVAPTVHKVTSSEQEESFARAEQAYRSLVCPSCGQGRLKPRSDGSFADCDLCGCTVDIRTRQVSIERHEHVTNNIVYEHLGDRFQLTKGNTVLQGMTSAGEASDLVIPAGQGIRVIGDGLLLGSRTLRTLDLPEGLERIGASAFCNCSELREVKIPSTVNMIDSSAFENCTSLERIVISDGARLGENAFRGCTSLREVVIGENVTGGVGAFIACESLQRVTMGSCSNVADSMFANCPMLYEANLAEGIDTIDDYAFCDCRSLNALRFPSSLLRIGDAAFRGCEALVRTDIPAGVRKIGTNAFEGCDALVSVELPKAADLGDGSFKDCMRLSYVAFPEGTKRVPPAFFEGCRNLSEAKLPWTLESIGSRAFAGCERLRDCSVPPGVRVEASAFAGCNFLL